MRLRISVSLALLAVLTASVLWTSEAESAPPWRLAPDRPGPLATVQDDPGACFADLDRLGLTYNPLPDTRDARGCGVIDGVRFNTLPGGTRFTPALTTTCALARSLVRLEALVLQPAARELLGAPVVAADHAGTFNCRQIRGGGRLSQHATANAVDLRSFTLADGRTVTVRSDWRDGSDAGAFLSRVHRDACALFRVVLGPDFDANHRAHFHIDNGMIRFCR